MYKFNSIICCFFFYLPSNKLWITSCVSVSVCVWAHTSQRTGHNINANTDDKLQQKICPSTFIRWTSHCCDCVATLFYVAPLWILFFFQLNLLYIFPLSHSIFWFMNLVLIESNNIFYTNWFPMKSWLICECFVLNTVQIVQWGRKLLAYRLLIIFNPIQWKFKTQSSLQWKKTRFERKH